MQTAPAQSRPRANDAAFGGLLREWRARRGFSQLDLALAARTTQRHLSFIETGRTVPSREMVLRLAATIGAPLRQQNALLLAAGYAPVWQERDLAAPAMAAVNKALDYMLEQHEPFPAFVVDRRWNLLRANRGAGRLIEFLTGAQPQEPSTEPVNLAVALMSPDGLRPLIANWPEVALYFLRGVQADASADRSAETLALLSRLLAMPDVPALMEATLREGHSPVLPMHFRRGNTSLLLFTTIATLGTPRDVTLDEVRIECFFPMDDATETILRSLANG